MMEVNNMGNDEPVRKQYERILSKYDHLPALMRELAMTDADKLIQNLYDNDPMTKFLRSANPPNAFEMFKQ